jgi:type 1 glutamine amidotransferase
VVIAVTSGDMFDAPARTALEAFFAEGGGFVGVHSASATEYSWPFYHDRLVPVWFRTHPHSMNVMPGVLLRESSSSLLGDLPERWTRSDEFYTFYERPEELGLDVLLALDESTMGPEYTADCRVGYHPLAFTHERSGGRVFYTALGHTPESYSEPEFMGMLKRGIAWVAEPRYAARGADYRVLTAVEGWSRFDQIDIVDRFDGAVPEPFSLQRIRAFDGPPGIRAVLRVGPGRRAPDHVERARRGN